MLRRTCLFASSLLLTPFALAEEKVGIRPNSVPSHPEYEELRAGTQIEHLYESMLANGFGIKNPDAKPTNLLSLSCPTHSVPGVQSCGMPLCLCRARSILFGSRFPY